MGESGQYQKSDGQVGQDRSDNPDIRMLADASGRLRHAVPERLCGDGIIGGDPSDGLQKIATGLGRENGSAQRAALSMIESISAKTSWRS